MKNTFDGFLQNSPPIIMGGVLMFRSERMRRTGARSTASGTSSPMQSWADCITATHESSFWKRHPRHAGRAGKRDGEGIAQLYDAGGDGIAGGKPRPGL